MPSHPLQVRTSDRQRLGNSRQLHPAHQAAAPMHKSIQLRLRCNHADLVRNIDGEKIARLQKSIHGAQVDMVGVAEVRLMPSELAHGRVRCSPGPGRFRADDRVLAVGFVPHRRHHCSCLRRLHDRRATAPAPDAQTGLQPRSKICPATSFSILAFPSLAYFATVSAVGKKSFSMMNKTHVDTSGTTFLD